MCVLFTLLLSLYVNLVPAYRVFVPVTCLSYDISWVWKCFKLSKMKVCIFTLSSRIFRFTPYMGKSEKYAGILKIVNIYEIINYHFQFYAGDYS
jgi:hypothetical protein